MNAVLGSLLTWSRVQSVLTRLHGWSGQSAVLLIQVNHCVHAYTCEKQNVKVKDVTLTFLALVSF